MTSPPARPPERAPRELTVPVTALGGARGGPGRAALLAALVVVVLIAGAVASSDLFPVRPPPVATNAPIVSVTDPPATSGPSPSAGLTLRIATTPVDVSQLVAGVSSGADAGWLVLVDGRLHASPLPCSSPTPRPGCLLLTIDGLRGLRVVADPAMAAWPGDPARGSVLVLEARDRQLVYLGSLNVDPAGIENVAGLLARLVGRAPERVGTLPTIYEADGWLLANPPCADPSGCPPQTPFLAAREPAADGGIRADGGGFAGVNVMVASAAIDPTDTLTTGPFLLRRRAAIDCPQGIGRPCFPSPDTWEVIAREDPARTIRVLLPGS